MSFKLTSESQDQVKQFFDAMLDFVFITDLQGQIIHINKKVVNFLGYSEQEIYTMNVLQLHPPDQQEEAKKVFLSILEGKQDACHIGLNTKDGSYIPAETKAFRANWGHQEALIAISRDLTEQKKVENLLIQQNEHKQYRIQFEELLTSISSKFINLPSHEMDSHINEVLKQAGEFEKVDRSYVFLIDEELQEINNTHEWCAPGIEPQKENLQHQPYDFTPWWMSKLYKLEEIILNHVLDLPQEATSEKKILEDQSIQSLIVVPLSAGRKLIGFLGFDAVKKQRSWSSDTLLFINTLGHVISNALKRKKMEQDLQQKELQNTALLNAVPDFIFRIRKDGTILEYKSAYSNLVFNRKNRIRGNKMTDYLDPSIAQPVLQCIEKALQTGRVQTLEYDVVIKEIKHTFEARINKFGEDEVIAVARDICERKRLEKIKSDFINRTAHDLRTPIATMNLMAELLNNHTFSDENKEYWEVLKNELSRQRTMVEKLLSTARLENEELPMNIQTIDLKALLKEVVEIVQIHAMSKQITIKFEECEKIKDTSLEILGDHHSIFQVFLNLLNNAVKFSPKNEKVSIMLAVEGPDVIVTIADKGIGIPEEDQEYLFMSFFRAANATENEIQGTGLGLYIVKTILERHGGNISVKSELNRGSVFKVMIPQKKE